jgi:hypothetical protein
MSEFHTEIRSDITRKWPRGAQVISYTCPLAIVAKPGLALRARSCISPVPKLYRKCGDPAALAKNAGDDHLFSRFRGNFPLPVPEPDPLPAWR